MANILDAAKARLIRSSILGVDTPVVLADGRGAPAVNLDNGATAPAFLQVAEEIHNQLLFYGSIGRGKGQKSEHSNRVYTQGREIVKGFVGARDDAYTVFYCANTTDGMNKLASALIESPNDLVLSTRMEHHANDLPWRERCRTLYVDVDAQGRLCVDEYDKILRGCQGTVKYVTVTGASNVTGYVNDVHRIARVAHAYGAKIIVDGAQLVAHRGFSMLGNTPDENIDFFVFSAHKMYAPYGGGAVVGLAKVLDACIPKFYGGGMVRSVHDWSVCYTSQPDLYEAGSPNYPGVVGMLKAIEMLGLIGFDYIEAHEQQLLRRTIDGLRRIPRVQLYGDSDRIADRVGTVVFTIRGMENETVAYELAARRGIAVRHAAFCAHPYVRRLTGEPDGGESGDPCASPKGMVRVSYGVYNDENDVDALVRTVAEIAQAGDVTTTPLYAQPQTFGAYNTPNDRA